MHSNGKRSNLSTHLPQSGFAQHQENAGCLQLQFFSILLVTELLNPSVASYHHPGSLFAAEARGTGALSSQT